MSELQRQDYGTQIAALKASLPPDIDAVDRRLAEAGLSLVLQVLCDFNRIADALELLARR